VKKKLQVECPNCHTQNRLDVETALVSHYPLRFKAEKPIIAYLSKRTQKCQKCDTVLAENDDVFKIEGMQGVKYRVKDIDLNQRYEKGSSCRVQEHSSDERERTRQSSQLPLPCLPAQDLALVFIAPLTPYAQRLLLKRNTDATTMITKTAPATIYKV
jgi:hypothetical protein